MIDRQVAIESDSFHGADPTTDGSVVTTAAGDRFLTAARHPPAVIAPYKISTYRALRCGLALAFPQSGSRSQGGGAPLLHRSDFSVLVLRGDGRWVRWLSVPSWLPKTLVVLAALGAVANGAVLLHYMSLSREHASLVATNTLLERHAGALPPIRRRLAELRDEMIEWETLHAAIWKPLGGQQRAAIVGIGGPALAARTAGKKLDDLDVLLAHVGPRLSPWTGAPEFHAGVDLAAGSGTPVKAPSAGVVRFAGTAEGYGQSIILDHGAGIESRFGHLQKIGVARGQRVERGQLIGLTGNTGRSTAPHLHYEVRVDGRPVDPRRLTRE